MNPPAAIHNAMNRERKPFTYTPGGLDLSQIKSERMAQRLMRNAMNQGVPETQIQPVSSPPTPSTPIAVPNYNCLPVQVFPTFPLPSDPKSLLRARSIPDQSKEPQRSDSENISSANTNSQGINHKRNTLNQITPAFSQIRNSNSSSNRPVSMYEFTSAPVNSRTDYGSNGCTSLLPEISFDAEYFQVCPRKSGGNEIFKLPISNGNENLPSVNQYSRPQSVNSNLVKIDVPSDSNIASTTTVSTLDSEDQRGVRLVKKHVKKDKKVEKIEKRTETQNGDVAAEAEVTVKLPSKKPETKLNTNIEPGAKTETEVDVLKKILPDGSVEEVKTTTIRTTKDGKTETETKTETRKLPKEEADAAKQQARKSQLENKETENENGDVNENLELVVKLPTKKSGATTETKVETENKILSDGTVEETKTTTTKTTVDGKTEVTTKIDKRILSKEEADAAVEITEEEEEEEIEEEEETNTKNKASDKKEEKISENNIMKTTEHTEITTKKNVVVTQSTPEEKYESEEENEDEEGEESETVTVKQEKLTEKQESVEIDEEEETEENKEVEEEDTESNDKEIKEEVQVEESVEDVEIEKPAKDTIKEDDEKDVDIEEEEEIEEVAEKLEKEIEQEIQTKSDDEEKEEIDEEENEEEITEEVEVKEEETQSQSKNRVPESSDEDQEPEKDETSRTIPIETQSKIEYSDEKKEQQVTIQEPAVPLEKVEEIEIKPIGLSNETISKSQTEKTEIIVSTEKPTGPQSTQTEFNRYENIVKVNRTTKTLDHAYEQMTQQSIPTMKTYFAPNREKVSPSHPAQIGGTYDTSYVPDSATERRHSLLLERLSVERQIPPVNSYQNNYQQYTNQINEQQQSWSQEPQSEVVTVSNVKPSTITNQHWYQQTTKDNVVYNNISSTVPSTPSQQWNQPQPQYQTQPQYQSHSQYQTQPQYQSQQQYQPQTQYQPQPQYQSQPEIPFQPQTQQPQNQPQYQQPYTENKIPDYSRTNSNTYQKNSLPSYVPKISNWGTSNTDKIENVSNQYSYLSKETTKPYKTTPQFSSDYVPPPWEQESSSLVDSSNQNFYQTPPSAKCSFTPSPSAWKPPPTPSNKFSKATPTAYIPPAPNQSFVKSGNSVAESPKTPGRKTYYSEYERRYISVPESNYIPGETKLQPQPDPSPKYYYDNNEPNETVEHEWRKELREFSEKTSQTQVETDRMSVKPPWEEDSKYVKTPSTTPYTPTPSWSQTLRPRSWRERSFESEYVGSQEWPKTNTLGRGRPVSSYVQNKPDVNVPERPRGVSVDRYNPNSYQSPIAEHPPVQSHTLTPTSVPHAKSYHNPNIPAYHARASAEPREQPSSYQQPRMWGDSRDAPIQSRSFKYLQWITGTEN